MTTVFLEICILLASGDHHVRLRARQAVMMAVTTPADAVGLLRVYWRQGKCPIAASLKKGLDDAFATFTPEQLDRYADREFIAPPITPIKLRDVLFLIHHKPPTPELEAAWKRLVARTS
jgi:60 kDa SS-A/Ro ribonucleoprotein